MIRNIDLLYSLSFFITMLYQVTQVRCTVLEYKHGRSHHLRYPDKFRVQVVYSKEENSETTVDPSLGPISLRSIPLDNEEIAEDIAKAILKPLPSRIEAKKKSLNQNERMMQIIRSHLNDIAKHKATRKAIIYKLHDVLTQRRKKASRQNLLQSQYYKKHHRQPPGWMFRIVDGSEVSSTADNIYS